MPGLRLAQGNPILQSASGARHLKLSHNNFGPIRPSYQRQDRKSPKRLSVKASALSDLISATFFTTAAAGLVYSSIPLLNGTAKTNNQGKIDTSGQSDIEPEGIKWGAMSVVSFIPLVNWTVPDLVRNSHSCAFNLQCTIKA